MMGSIFDCNSAKFCGDTKRHLARKIHLNLNDNKISVDLPSFDGNHFKYQHIGGLVTEGMSKKELFDCS